MRVQMIAMTGVCHFIYYSVALLLDVNPGIRKATAWYNSHIALNFPPIRGQTISRSAAVLLTDDAANRTLAGKDDIPCVSGTCPEYV